MIQKPGEVGARTIGLIACALSLAAASCTRDDAAARRPSRLAVVPDTVTARVDPAEAGGEVVGDWIDEPVTERWITDANVLSLFAAMNARQISAADIELENWHDDGVRAFAASVAREHAELQHAVDSLSARLRITPIAPALTKPWMSVMQAQIDSLRRARDVTLDRAFVHQQIVSHQLMLERIQQLASASQHRDVQAMLSVAAKRIAAQLDRARSLESAIAARTTSR